MASAFFKESAHMFLGAGLFTATLYELNYMNG